MLFKELQQKDCFYKNNELYMKLGPDRPSTHYCNWSSDDMTKYNSIGIKLYSKTFNEYRLFKLEDKVDKSS